MREFSKCFLFLVFWGAVSFLPAQTKNPFVKNVENAYGYFGFPFWSPDGSSFAAVAGDCVAIYNADDLSIIKKFDPPPSDNKRALISSIQFCQNGKKLLVLKNDHSIAVYDVTSGLLNYVISADRTAAETAVFGASDFSLLIPFDGKNLFSYFYLIASQSFILTKKFDFNKRILFLSRSADSKKLLVSTIDSKAYLLVNKDDSWQNLAEYSWSDESFVYPKISSDGSAFLFATAKNKIVVAHIGEDEEEKPVLTEILLNENLAGEADFSADGKYLFLGTKDNRLCVYDAFEGKLLKTLVLGETESLSAGAFSPDCEKLLFTTKKGSLYLWEFLADDSGLELFANRPEFVQNSINYDADLTAVITGTAPAGNSGAGEGTDGTGTAGVNLPFNVDYLQRKGLWTELQLELSSVPDPFLLSLGADFSVVSYDILKPFFIGGRFRPFIAFPKEDFPYSYTNNDKALDSPCLAGFELCLPFGIFMMPFADRKFGVSAEVSAGASLLYLWNKKFGQEFHRSGIFYSFDFAGRLGLYFNCLNVFAGVEWDSILKFCVNAGAGICLRLGGKE